LASAWPIARRTADGLFFVFRAEYDRLTDLSAAQLRQELWSR
jgi:hypothetical protein